ncbi:MAG: hypothetical protein IPJ04_17165 [Candidatus Eisenbacteria bacterium]|nr:hypothetical protein [Candidatus Eisenbacteria bacterium]
MLDYSRANLDSLNETSLDEFYGFGSVPADQRVVSIPYSDSTGRLRHARLQQGERVDWSGDGMIENISYAGNLNLWSDSTNAAGEAFTGHQDWSGLVYDFRHSASFQPPAFSGPPSERRIARPATSEQLPNMRELSRDDDARLRTIPPPRPAGRYVMDGVIDSRARMVATNAGAELWADYRDGVLYVAATPSGSAGSDLHVLVATSRGALVAAPGGKAGRSAPSRPTSRARARAAIPVWRAPGARTSAWSRSTRRASRSKACST